MSGKSRKNFKRLEIFEARSSHWVTSHKTKRRLKITGHIFRRLVHSCNRINKGLVVRKTFFLKLCLILLDLMITTGFYRFLNSTYTLPEMQFEEVHKKLSKYLAQLNESSGQYENLFRGIIKSIHKYTYFTDDSD